MLEVLTATGLALAAGLNAWIPLLVIGALDRFTGLVELPAGWEWLSNEWVLLILLVLLVVEVVADKVPGLDSLNDIVQTVVRPTAGGLAFGSGVGATTTAVTDPGQVKKVVEGLNAILALGEGEESWSITSAEAVDGDRLVRVRIEARDKGEGLSRSFRAAEARFVLIPSTRTLEVRFRDGEVTYPGNRTVEFPGGRYSALLTVDPAPVRNAAHPLVEVPAR